MYWIRSIWPSRSAANEVKQLPVKRSAPKTITASRPIGKPYICKGEEAQCCLINAEVKRANNREENIRL